MSFHAGNITLIINLKSFSNWFQSFSQISNPIFSSNLKSSSHSSGKSKIKSQIFNFHFKLDTFIHRFFTTSKTTQYCQLQQYNHSKLNCTRSSSASTVHAVSQALHGRALEKMGTHGTHRFPTEAGMTVMGGRGQVAMTRERILTPM